VTDASATLRLSFNLGNDLLLIPHVKSKTSPERLKTLFSRFTSLLFCFFVLKKTGDILTSIGVGKGVLVLPWILKFDNFLVTL